MDDPPDERSPTYNTAREKLLHLLKEDKSSEQTNLLLDIDVIDRYHLKVAIGVFVTWFVINATAIYFTPESYRMNTPDICQNIEKTVSIFLLLSLLSRILPGICLGPIESKKIRSYSGVLILALVVHFCTAISNGFMGWYPSIIYTERITKTEINVLRWCEWVPFSFAMAFLADGIDAEDISSPFELAMTQATATILGALLPFISSFLEWFIVLFIAFLLFCNVYRKAHMKWKRLKHFPRGESIEELEEYERIALATRLIIMGAVAWTFLVLLYIFRWYMKYAYDYQRIEMQEILESLVDVVAKHFYSDIVVHAHNRIFSSEVRTERRLDELRKTMAMIWNSSEDVLMISVKSDSGRVKTKMSPALLKIITSLKDVDNHHDSMIFDENCFTIEQNIIFSARETMSSYNAIEDIKTIISTVWTHKLDQKNNNTNNNSSKLFLSRKLRMFDKPNESINCELSVAYLHEDSIVMVLRDVTERHLRFEAEKRMVSQITSRKKDNEANRFTRHEVKNGLLAAIGLCDNLREDYVLPLGQVESPGKMSSNKNEKKPSFVSKSKLETNYLEKIEEIDNALNQTLDIVTEHTMSRDLLNGEYVPCNEVIDLPHFFTQEHLNNTRFDISVVPEPFPKITQDWKLLLCVYRNAVSNAMKYGKRKGNIGIQLHCNVGINMLEMKVINEPGLQHGEILKLSSEEKEIIFLPGKSLHYQSKFDSRSITMKERSAGDGAWIMKNCAVTMGGTCDYTFKPDKTIFSLSVPVKLPHSISNPDFPVENFYTNTIDKPPVPVQSHVQILPLPVGTWGIAIDDSRVQRKLLKKCFSSFGIDKDKIIVTGASFEEIKRFPDSVVSLVQQYPSDYILIIADENLDVADEHHGSHKFLSGSLAIQEILNSLRIQRKDANVLALVRSANDSSTEIEHYVSRSHGFLPKAPLNKSSLESILGPIWLKRFRNKLEGRQDDQLKSLKREREGEDLISGENDEHVGVQEDFMYVLNRIETLVQDETKDESSWDFFRELLHLLKGDLLTQAFDNSNASAVEIIDKIKKKKCWDEQVSNLWNDVKFYTMQTLKVSGLKRRKLK